MPNARPTHTAHTISNAERIAINDASGLRDGLDPHTIAARGAAKETDMPAKTRKLTAKEQQADRDRKDAVAQTEARTTRTRKPKADTTQTTRTAKRAAHSDTTLTAATVARDNELDARKFRAFLRSNDMPRQFDTKAAATKAVKAFRKSIA